MAIKFIPVPQSIQHPVALESLKGGDTFLWGVHTAMKQNNPTPHTAFSLTYAVPLYISPVAMVKPCEVTVGEIINKGVNSAD